jgi:hypothetical protein
MRLTCTAFPTPDYEFECATDEEAKRRAASYLQAHPVIEVWQGVRRVVRLTRLTAHLGIKDPSITYLTRRSYRSVGMARLRKTRI